MHRKDYLRAVDVIKSQRWIRDTTERTLLIDTFVEFFRDDNPQFNEDRFRGACEDE
jgi:hypothetical protein